MVCFACISMYGFFVTYLDITVCVCVCVCACVRKMKGSARALLCVCMHTRKIKASACVHTYNEGQCVCKRKDCVRTYVRKIQALYV